MENNKDTAQALSKEQLEQVSGGRDSGSYCMTRCPGCGKTRTYFTPRPNVVCDGCGMAYDPEKYKFFVEG